MCDAAKAVLRGAFSDTGLPQETRNQKKEKSQATNLTHHLKELGRKRTTNNAQSQQKEKENNKYQ